MRSWPLWCRATTHAEATFRGFTDLRLRAAIVDRLTFAGHIFETGTTSYRLAHARATGARG